LSLELVIDKKLIDLKTQKSLNIAISLKSLKLSKSTKSSIFSKLACLLDGYAFLYKKEKKSTKKDHL
jgi:hypothetical protein